MKSVTLLSAAALVASTALAQPHGSHNHAHQHRQAHARHAAHEHAHEHAHEKRALKTEWATEWVTETVTEYIDVTATSWITTGALTVTSTESRTTSVAAQFFEGASSSSSSTSVVQQAPPPPAPETTSVYVPPTTSQPPAVVETVPPAAAQPKPAEPSTSTSAGPAPAQPATNNKSGGSGAAYSGEVTHYTVGLGACGENDTGKDRSDYIVALSHALMTSGTWPDAQCGKTVTFSYNGKSVTGTVRDKCPSCSPDQIDVSEKAFLDLFGDLGIGRARGVSWTLNG